MKDLAAFTQEFDVLTSLVRRAIEEKDGATVDVAALGLKTTQLCMSAEQAAPEIAHQLKPIMAQLIQDLDELATILKQQEKGL